MTRHRGWRASHPRCMARSGSLDLDDSALGRVEREGLDGRRVGQTVALAPVDGSRVTTRVVAVGRLERGREGSEVQVLASRVDSLDDDVADHPALGVVLLVLVVVPVAVGLHRSLKSGASGHIAVRWREGVEGEDL